MLIKKSKFHIRLLVALALLIASVLTNLLITGISNQQSNYWIAQRELSPGQQIAATDISQVRVNLASISANYLSVGVNPVGSIVTTRIPKSSLISKNSVSTDSSSINSAEISLTIRAIDLPIAAQAGDRISIYLLEDAQPGAFPVDPELILSDIYLGTLNRKSSNFGSDVAITIAIGREEIANVLRATTYGRLVIVKLNG
jgi:hypothetical protein